MTLTVLLIGVRPSVHFYTKCAVPVLICAVLTARLSGGANSAPPRLLVGFRGGEKGKRGERERGNGKWEGKRNKEKGGKESGRGQLEGKRKEGKGREREDGMGSGRML